LNIQKEVEILESIKEVIRDGLETVFNSVDFAQGMASLTCEFTFNEPWKGLVKNVTFRAGNTSKTIINIKDNKAIVPKVVLDEVGAILEIGVEGFSPSGPLEISTVYAAAGRIRQGASVEEQEDVPEIWQ
jgi:hypothetical protein